ncbi:putative HLH transcription factor [Lentinula edodes]|uniref:putative HLH transcription factor n=1 Tax=Lentinula edodes TaxID=5353 RepID=UPI001E8DC671|nr:putative HLH transcription factor [Lentinula edodes]KAH7881102.1 putative HLH transcription factor [Lentinula edodes]KAJ3918555.1 putative HLH transcription factor [Lentinula edodes]
MQSPLMPPVPYADFQLSFDPQLSNLFPHPPQLPPSAELFSPSETNELFNFLDGFDGSIWDTEPDSLDHHSFGPLPESPRLPPHSPYSNPHLKTVPKPNPAAPLSRPRRTARVKPGRTAPRNTSKSSSHTSSSTTPPAQSFDEPSSPMLDNTSTQSTLTQSRASARTKTLLSTPQKRLNHIMSEQKRRNAIRDGYAQLITLLAPSGNAPALGMPTRGRPKGSGSRAKAGKKVGNDADGAKGKSGVLFRAVEYCRWLEEGREALRKEVARVEAAADLTGT